MSEQNVTIPAAELARLRGIEAELTKLRTVYVAAVEENRAAQIVMITGRYQDDYGQARKAHRTARAEAGMEEGL